MKKEPFSTDVQTSQGVVKIYWWANAFYWPEAWTKGYMIMEVHGYDFPEQYWGKLFHLYEDGENQYEYLEDSVKSNIKLPDDLRAILDAVKDATPKLVKHEK